VINLPRNDAVALQFAQLLREHLLGHIGQQASKFTEAMAAVEDKTERSASIFRR
jgi:hypothetical protein